MKNKHLSFDDRLEIEKGLKENISFKQIGFTIEKNCTTISKEIRNNIVFKDTGSPGRPFFDCINGSDCKFVIKELGVILIIVIIILKIYVFFYPNLLMFVMMAIKKYMYS